MAKKKRHFKKLSPEKRLEKSHEKIDEIFDKKLNTKLSIKGEKATKSGVKKHTGKGNSFSTIKTYKAAMKDLMRELNVVDFKEINPDNVQEYLDREIENYHDGDFAAAGRVKKRMSALRSFQQGVYHTNVLSDGAKKEVQLGNVDRYNKYMLDHDVYRSNKTSTWAVPTNRQMRTVKDRVDKIAEETGDPVDKTLSDYVRFAQITGSRVNNGLKVRAEHITENTDGTVDVLFEDDKGGLSRENWVVGQESVKFLKDLKSRAKRGKLFQGFRADGTPLSADSLQKELNDRFKVATEGLTTNEKVTVRKNGKEFEVEKKIVFHSCRKSFATNEATDLVEYFLKNPKETQKRMDEAFNKMAAKEPKVRQKYEALLEKKNGRNKSKAHEGLSAPDMALYLTSCKLGHFRLDVIKASYLDSEAFNKAVAKYKK